MRHSDGSRDDLPYWLQALALICYVASGFIVGTVLVAVLK